MTRPRIQSRSLRAPASRHGVPNRPGIGQKLPYHRFVVTNKAAGGQFQHLTNFPKQLLFEQIRDRNAQGEAVAMATIVRSRGSTPQKVGARMLVFESGAGAGTVGGGCVEASIWQAAATAIADGNPRMLRVDLVDDLRGEGDVCGGTVDVFIDLWSPAER